MAMTDSPTMRSDEVPRPITGSGSRGIDLDEREVGLLVEAEDAGGVPGAVVEPHPEGVHVIDDVEVREDVAARVEDDAGAHAVDALRLHRLAERVIGRRADRPLAVDVDHRRLDLVVDVHDLIPALAGRDLPLGGRGGGGGWLKGGGDRWRAPIAAARPAGHEQSAAGGADE